MQKALVTIVHDIFAMIRRIEKCRTTICILQYTGQAVQKMVGIQDRIIVGIDKHITIGTAYFDKIIGAEPGKFLRIPFMVVEMRSVSIQYNKQITSYTIHTMLQFGKQYLVIVIGVFIEKAEIFTIIGFLGKIVGKGAVSRLIGKKKSGKTDLLKGCKNTFLPVNNSVVFG